MYGRIRRENSALADGTMFGRRRRGIHLWHIGLTLVIILFAVGAIWQFNTIQPKVLALVGSQATATPNAVVHAQLGYQAYLQGDLTNAILNYRAAATQDPTNVDIVYELVRSLIYHSYGDVRFNSEIDEAVKWGTQLVTANPNSDRANGIYCYALVRKSQDEDAVRSCIRAISINDNNGDSHAFLSMAYYDLQRYNAALDEGQRSVSLDPNSIDGHGAYAYALNFQGKNTQALDEFKQATKINPRLEFPYFNLGAFARNLGIHGDDGMFLVAITAYNAVLKVNPNSVKAYTRLCETYLAKNNQDSDRLDARDYCQKAISLDEGYALAWRWLGEVQHRSRNYEDAIDSLAKCVDLEKDLPPDERDAICWWLQAADQFILGYCDKAQPLLEDVLTWTTDPIAIRETRTVINKCATAYQGKYQTPVPIPTSTPKPTPIL